MASYSIQIKRSAAKEIEALPVRDRRRVVQRIETLAAEPRPPGAEKLSGADSYRIRQGDYRILYQIIDHDLIVMVVKVGHRGDVYRR